MNSMEMAIEKASDALQKPPELERCVEHLKEQGHDEDSAWAICQDSVNKGEVDTVLDKTDEIAKKAEEYGEEHPEVSESEAWRRTAARVAAQEEGSKASLSEEAQSSQEGNARRESGAMSKAVTGDGEITDYEELDDALKKAYEDTVWWGLGDDDRDLSKAPSVFPDDVPQMVKDNIIEAIQEGAMWAGDIAGFPDSAARRIQQEVQTQLTQSGGWSLHDLVNGIQDLFGGNMGEDQAEVVARNETAAVLNSAREEAYEDRDTEEEYVFDWIGPDDFRTTETCESIKAIIESRGGSVPMEELKDILEAVARERSDEEGTPGRVDDFLPHWQCRHSFVRRVQR